MYLQIDDPVAFKDGDYVSFGKVHKIVREMSKGGEKVTVVVAKRDGGFFERSESEICVPDQSTAYSSFGKLVQSLPSFEWATKEPEEPEEVVAPMPAAPDLEAGKSDF